MDNGTTSTFNAIFPCASPSDSSTHNIATSCDECQRVGNISRRNEMPMNYSLVIEPFDCWGFDFMDPH